MTTSRIDRDVLATLDALLAGHDGPWWDGFYADRARPCPFFEAGPDESLAEWHGQGHLRGGRALDLGCGHGRNAIFLAQQGFEVTAVDYSPKALEWAAERARQAGVAPQWVCRSVFDFEPAAGSYDLVYDSGCFHHLPPHRRRDYADRVAHALAHGGWFGLTCFRPEGGSGLTDREVYERRGLGGGLGYTEAQMRAAWQPPLQVQTLRPMHPQAAGSGCFGEDFLWVLWARKG